jgi:predicted unusual protein kinase regulating ubiquinone biosynthesis (AarF/ABC1/UbiB family)
LACSTSVHRATLKDGTRVVVKVKYPKAEPLLRGDVRTIKAFAQLAQPVHVPALEQIEKQVSFANPPELAAKIISILNVEVLLY